MAKDKVDKVAKAPKAIKMGLVKKGGRVDYVCEECKTIIDKGTPHFRSGNSPNFKRYCTKCAKKIAGKIIPENVDKTPAVTPEATTETAPETAPVTITGTTGTKSSAKPAAKATTGSATKKAPAKPGKK